MSNRRKSTRRLTEAIAVKSATGGDSYADILRKLKSQVDPVKCGAVIAGIRRTKNGELLVEIKKGGNIENLRSAVETSLGMDASVRTMSRKICLQVLDIDEVTEEQEVAKAIREALPADHKDPVTVKMWKSYRGCQAATITTTASTAEILLKLGK